MPKKHLLRKDVQAILPQTGCLCIPNEFQPFDEEVGGKGFWKIRKNNFFLKRHFGCIPGSIIIEFIEQVAALLIMSEYDIEGDPIVCRLDDPGPNFGRFKTVAGDTLIGTVTLTKSKRGMYYLDGMVVNQNGITVLKTGIVGAAAEKKKPIASIAGKSLALEE
jgi:hypothetical protein